MLARLCTSYGFEPSADDGAYFLDRDPEMFKPIMFYLRMGKLEPKISKENILEEAKYFMMEKLVNIIETEIEEEKIYAFSPGPNYALSNNNKIATINNNVSGYEANVLTKGFLKGTRIWNIKITTGNSGFFIGVAPIDIDQNGTTMYSQNGWYFYTYNSTLFSGPPMNYSGKQYSNTSLQRPFGAFGITPAPSGIHRNSFANNGVQPPVLVPTMAIFNNVSPMIVSTGSTVSVKLDMDKQEISFIINGTDRGVAYNNIPTDKKLCLCVILRSTNDSVELI